MDVINNKIHILKTVEKVLIRNGMKTDASRLLEIARSVLKEGEFRVTTPEEFLIGPGIY